ncbi:MAG: hypothetical protein AAGU32_18460 [Bacillota bacterium]
MAQVLGALSFGALLAALRFVSGGVWLRPVLTGAVLFFFVGLHQETSHDACDQIPLF